MSSLPERPEVALNTTIDGVEVTVAAAVSDLLRASAAYEPKRAVSIATAYFNVDGWSLISEQLRRAGRVRILLGAEPTDPTGTHTLRMPEIPRHRAPQVRLEEGLAAQAHALRIDRDLVPFTPEARAAVADLVQWLTSGAVEVRRFTAGFLHGKAYVIDAPRFGLLAGSSNLTAAGLSRNHELNIGNYSPTVVAAVAEWFDGLWEQAEPYDLAAFYEQKIAPAAPWLVYLRMLWEAYGTELAQDEADELDPAIANLLPFQRDGVARARRIIERHNGVLIADEVGLGKTFIGGALVKDTTRIRQRVLIIAPKVIRDNVWKPYIDREHLGGWVDTISYDDLIREEVNGKPWGLEVARNRDDYSMVLLDEAHTVRNNDTLRARELVSILARNPRKKVVLLTATPVNNALTDLHSLLSYFIMHDDEFATAGIPSLSAYFRQIDRLAVEDLSPEHLFDILDAVAVRRTRAFVRAHYAGQKLADGQELVFPEPRVHRVDYEFDSAFHGFFTRFAHALGADTDPDTGDPFFQGRIPAGGLATLDPTRLTLAGYTPTRYRLENIDRRQQAAEVQVAGLLRSGLLKRFESSSSAFISTCRTMAATLEDLKGFVEEQGLVVSSEALREWLRVDDDDIAGIDEWRDWAEPSPLEEFQAEALLADMAADIAILRALADEVEGFSVGVDDPKIAALRETLVALVRDAAKAAAARARTGQGDAGLDPAVRERDDRKVLVFSYFADTVAYLHEHLYLILDHPDLAVYRDRVAFVSGRSSKGGPWVSQESAVSGFAPRTGGPVDKDGVPTGPDTFDLVVTTDVLSQGVNLQQAHIIINFDLPWNPMRLVQRHGRVDRIGSIHDYIELYCFFPSTDLDEYLQLERTLQRKLAKAAKSIGVGRVLPGVEPEDDVVFNTQIAQIEDLAREGNDLFVRDGVGLISGEEFRAMLRKILAMQGQRELIAGLPLGVGSGFAVSGRRPGFVFCARVLDQRGEPAFRFVALPDPLLPGSIAEPVPVPEEIVADNPLDYLEIHGQVCRVFGDGLTALTQARPPEQGTPALLPEKWVELAFDAWAAARANIAATWNAGLDPAAGAGIPPAVNAAIRHIIDHSKHRNEKEAAEAIKALRRVNARRAVSAIRAALKDPALTDALRTDRLIELVDEMGLVVPPRRAKVYEIDADDVHLVAWMAVIPEEDGRGGDAA